MLKSQLTCEQCDKSFFNNQSDFVRHIKNLHSETYNKDSTTLYICKYGPCIEILKDFQSTIELINHINVKHVHPTGFFNWSINECSVNLPALLNDPKNRQNDIFSKTWGENFDKKDYGPARHLEDVTLNHVKNYLARIKLRQDSGNVRLSSEYTANEKANDSVDSIIPELSNYFFRNDFSLNDNEIFLKTIPIQKRMKTKDPKELRKAFSNQHDLLSVFLDKVELKIVKQVSAKSGSFFVAILGQTVAKEQLKSTIDLVHSIRSDMQRGAHLSISGVEELLVIAKRRARLIEIRSKLKLIATVRGTQCTLQSLLNQRDYLSVWDILTSSISILEEPLVKSVDQSKEPTKSLQNLCAVHHLSQQLKEYHKLIEAIIDDDFEKQINGYMEFYSETLKGHGIEECLLDYQNDLSNNQIYLDFITFQILPCITGYLRMEKYTMIHRLKVSGINLIKEIFEYFIKSISKNHHGSSHGNTLFNGDLDCDSSSSQVSVLLRNLTDERWLSYLVKLIHYIKFGFDHINLCFTTIASSIEEYLSENQSQQRALCESTLDALLLEIKKLEKDICQIAQLQLKNLLIARYSAYFYRETNKSDVNREKNYNLASISSFAKTPSTSSLGSTDDSKNEEKFQKIDFSQIVELAKILAPFQALIYESWEKLGEFAMPKVNETFLPKVSKSFGPSPRGSPIEISLFIHYFWSSYLRLFHDERRTKMNMFLVKEQWLASVVPDYIQRLADSLHDLTEPLKNVSGSLTDSHSKLFITFDAFMSFKYYAQSDSFDMTTLSYVTGKKENCSGNLIFQSIHLQEQPFNIWPTLPKDEFHSDNNPQYILVNGVLLFLPIITDYIKVARSNLLNLLESGILPANYKSKDDTLGGFYEKFANIFSLFNTRMCQLILGAEARKSTVGSSISARNLALAVRSMEFILSILSRVMILYDHNFGIDVHLINKSAQLANYKNPFFAVEKSIRSHIHDLYSKLLMVLTSRFEVRLSLWTPKPPIPTNEMKETTSYMMKFTKAISDILTPNFSKALIICAHNHFKKKISRRTKEIPITRGNGPIYSLVEQDLSHYLTQFQKLLPDLEHFEDDFHDIWD